VVLKAALFYGLSIFIVSIFNDIEGGLGYFVPVELFSATVLLAHLTKRC
jgi:hypothetical protein